MFLYVRRSATHLEVNIPFNLQQSILADNAVFNELKPLYDYHQQLVDIFVYDCRSPTDESSKITVHNSTSLCDLLTNICTGKLFEQPREQTPAIPFSLENFRLRRFNPSLCRPTTTYCGRETESLNALGIRSGDALYIETKLPEAVFQEYVHSVSWTDGPKGLGSDPSSIDIYLWIRQDSQEVGTSENSDVRDCSKHRLTQKVGAVKIHRSDSSAGLGERIDAGAGSSSGGYLVRNLRAAVAAFVELIVSNNSAIATALGCNDHSSSLLDPSRLHLVSIDALSMLAPVSVDSGLGLDGLDTLDCSSALISEVFYIGDDESEVTIRDSRFFDGLIVELLPAGCSWMSDTFSSQALAFVSSVKGQIKVKFNVPFENKIELKQEISGGDSIADIYTESLSIASTSTISDLKLAIGHYFSDHSFNNSTGTSLTAQDFYLCWRDGSMQIKEDSRTLKEHGISHSSSIFVKVFFIFSIEQQRLSIIS
jgi:hypothetical protein